MVSVSSQRVSARAVAGRNGGASHGHASAAGQQTAADATLQIRADVAKFFIDLRRTIGATPIQAAQRLATSPQIIAALERANVGMLPPWPETCRIVMSYAAWAGIDGRPVLTALGILAKEADQHRQTVKQAAAVRPAVTASSERLAAMRYAISQSALRLPREAFNQARERPVRTFYALSVPLLALMFMMHSHFLRDAGSLMWRPFKAVVTVVHDRFAVSFAPRREGLRWIEVSDPRRRRSDKLDGSRS